MLYYILFNQNMTAKEGAIVFLIAVFVYLISITVHEFAHGYTAYKMGDLTPKLAGRLTLNPFSHLSPFGFLLFIFLGIGWAKPVPVNPMAFKKYRLGTRLVSIAGVTANFILGLIASLICLLLLHTVNSVSETMNYVIIFLQYTMLVNSFLIMFNILPICPLDGFNFVSTFCSAENKFVKYGIRNSGRIILTILFASLFIEIFTGFDIFNYYLALCYDYILYPISIIGV